MKSNFIGTQSWYKGIHHFAGQLTVVHSFEFGIRPIRNESNYITTIVMIIALLSLVSQKFECFLRLARDLQSAVYEQ